MIYESSTIRVEDCTIDGDRTNVVVTFPFARGKDGFRDPFGKEFFARRAISAIHITISTSNWFQSEELNAALSAVRTRTAQFDRVVTYGQSMGGYGAIAASAAVGAHAILAMAPQFSLDRAKVPWEKRWPVQHTAIVDGGGYVRDELEELIAPEAELYLVYDPRTVDSRHVDLIIPISRNAIPIPIPFAGHKIAQFLLDAKLLSELVESIVRGMPFDGKAWRKRFRAVRSGLGHWWMEVSDGARRRTALTVLAARRALAIEPQGRRQQVVMAKALISTNQYEEAVIFLSDVVATFPKDGPLRMMLGYALLRAGRPEKALQEFETVALLMPASGDVITMMERARDVIAKKDQPIGKDVIYDAMAAKATPSIDAGRFENIPTASDVVLGPLLPGSSKFGESFECSDPTLPLHNYHGYHLRDVATRTLFESPPEIEQFVEGTAIYAGSLHLHFAHFLADSIHRLWARKVDPALADAPIAYHIKRRARPTFPQWAIDIFALLAIKPSDIIFINKTTQFERLAMPPQGRVLSGATQMPGYASLFPFDRNIVPASLQSPKKLYLSRSKHRYTGCYLGESYVEELLAAAGYTIIFPEEHPVPTMVAYFQNAETLVFAEGGAIQILQLCGEINASIFVIGRRRGSVSRFGDIIAHASRNSTVYEGVSGGTSLYPSGKSPETDSKAGNFIDVPKLFEALTAFTGDRFPPIDPARLHDAARLDLIDYLLDPRFPAKIMTPETVGKQFLALRRLASELGI